MEPIQGGSAYLPIRAIGNRDTKCVALGWFRCKISDMGERIKTILVLAAMFAVAPLAVGQQDFNPHNPANWTVRSSMSDEDTDQLRKLVKLLRFYAVSTARVPVADPESSGP